MQKKSASRLNVSLIMVAFSLLRYNFFHIPTQFLEETWAEMEVFKVGIFQFVFVDLGMTFSEALITIWLYNFLVTLVLDFFQVKVK